MGFAREQSILIAAPPEAVYDYVADLARHPEWADQTMEIRVEGSGPAGPGTQFSSTVHFMGTVRGTGEVVEARRPSTFAYECRDSSGHVRWTFTIRPSGAGSEVFHGFEMLSAPLWVRLIQPWFMYPVFGRRMVGNGLRNIKAKVEAAVAAAGA